MRMNWEIIHNQWEILDLVKTFSALVVGIVLGAERELKDKAAGFKTITIICLGSTLFTILSYKMGMGNSEDATRIASYVVSGIGFLGAGVIFKDGLTVNGLTTASIVWVAAAIGMAIGFGQFFTALTFLICSLLVIHTGGWITRNFFARHHNKMLIIKLKGEKQGLKQQIIEEIKPFTYKCDIKRIEVEHHEMSLFLDVKYKNDRADAFENYLLQSPHILSFSL